MFGNLPGHEKQAFFSLLDEYFTARPHLLSGQDGEAGSSTAAAPQPAPLPRRGNPPPPTARKPVQSSGSNSGVTLPAGLSSGKAIGSVKTASAGAAFGSMIMGKPREQGPKTPAEAMGGHLHSAAAKLNLGGQQQPRIPPATPSQPDLGHAEVLYEYKGTEAEDLSVGAFDVVKLLEKVNDDWWKAEATDGSGRSGLVPATYVKVI